MRLIALDVDEKSLSDKKSATKLNLVYREDIFALHEAQLNNR